MSTPNQSSRFGGDVVCHGETEVLGRGAAALRHAARARVPAAARSDPPRGANDWNPNFWKLRCAIETLNQDHAQGRWPDSQLRLSDDPRTIHLGAFSSPSPFIINVM